MGLERVFCFGGELNDISSQYVILCYARDGDYSPPSSAVVEHDEELYLLSPQTPSWRVVGQL
jgi:hypothetical protein